MTGANGAPSETRTYNSIGQLTQLQSGSLNLQYAYSATQNNGKITSETDVVSGEQVAYTYDSLNRLASATSSVNPGWGQSYTYDGFGNLTNQTVTKGTAPSLSVTYDPATNRRTGGECADANGNLNASSFTCGGGYIYDAENRIVAENPVWLGATPTVAYSYKPGNKRVWKGTNYVYNGQSNWSLPSNEEVTFWSITGQKLVAYNVTQYQPGGPDTLPQLVASQTGTNYYFGGKLVKNSTGYVTPDRLGSIGKYFPYGQERPSATMDGKEKFATYFRDSETGLDYANNRYHQPGMGRFMTPDQMGGDPKIPDSLNKYSYTGGDPVNRGDPSGATWVCDAYETCGEADLGLGPNSGVDAYNAQYCLIAFMTMDASYFLSNCVTQQTGGGDIRVTPLVPAGNSYTQSQMQGLTNGLNSAISHVSSSFDRASFFSGGSGEDAERDATNQLENTTYRLLPLAQGTGATTNGPLDVMVNTTGAFFAFSGANVPVTVQIPDADGVKINFTFKDASTLQGFILLHELGHQMGVYGDDTGDGVPPGANIANSRAVLDHCFNRDAQGTYY